MGCFFSVWTQCREQVPLGAHPFHQKAVKAKTAPLWSTAKIAFYSDLVLLPQILTHMGKLNFTHMIRHVDYSGSRGKNLAVLFARLSLEVVGKHFHGAIRLPQQCLDISLIKELCAITPGSVSSCGLSL